MTVAQFQAAEQHMNQMIIKFDQEMGPLWGGKQIHDARAQIKDDAQRFSVALAKFSADVSPGTVITNSIALAGN
jgi:hypothetical protein